jgi:hypothetical protein
MKYIDVIGKMALIALAAVCLLAAPALSMPMGDNNCRHGHGDMLCMTNNLTPEEMENMTLGELKEMRQQACNESGTCMQMCEGQSSVGNVGECGARGQMMGRDGQGGRMMGEQRNGMNGQEGRMMNRDGPGCDGPGMAGPGKMGSPLILLVGDLSVDELGSMTLNEIKDLANAKMQELENMTLAQVKQLEATQIQTRQNLTLAEIKEENRNMHQIERILRLSGSLDEPQA